MTLDKNVLDGISILTKTPDHVMKEMDKVWKKDGMIVPISFDYGHKLSVNDRSYYAFMNGIYGIITNELVYYIKSLIGDMNTIEIGAGNGTLGRALGIPITDSKLQERPDVVEYYNKVQNPVIIYPDDVEKLTDIEAVKKYKPQCVVGSWLTHRFNNNYPERAGNPDGINFHRLFAFGVRHIIMVGNIVTHKRNPLFRDSSIKHCMLPLPFLLSRTQRVGDDRLFIFEKK